MPIASEACSAGKVTRNSKRKLRFQQMAGSAAFMQAIIDSHHHVWRQQDMPWLVGPMLPRIFGPYEPLRRDYPMTEYLSDIAGSGVVKSVYVQANWAPAQAEGEVAWVQKTADETGWPHAI